MTARRYLQQLPLLVWLIVCSQLVEAHFVKLRNQKGDDVDLGGVRVGGTSVGDLKKIIANQTGIELNRVRLSTSRSEPLVDDQKLLSDYLELADELLFLRLCDDLKEPGRIHLHIKLERVELVVTKDKTLAWLKKEALGDRPTNLYRVFFDGKELQDETKTLGDLQFHRGAYVVIFHREDTFTVVVNQPAASSSSEFKLKLDSSLEDLKTLLNETGIDTNNQLLLHSNEVVRSDRKLFTCSKMFHLGLLLRLVDRLSKRGNRVVIYVKKPGIFDHFSVFIKSTNTVGNLKKFAAHVGISIPTEQMSLKLNGIELRDDSRKLDQFDIYDGAWIEVTNQNEG